MKEDKKIEALERQRREKEEAERLRQLAVEREARIELIRKENRENALRKPMLEDSVDHFQKILYKVRELKKGKKLQDEWIKYSKCDSLPDTRTPAAVRNYIYKFHHEHLDFCRNKINWWLMCDERSDMTQDITIADTRRRVIDEIRDPIGRFYDQKLAFFMKVYESLEETLRRKKVSSLRIQDLMTIRDSLREIALNFLDALTLEVLMNVDREMNSMTPYVSNYSYASRHFIKFIWATKGVELPIEYVVRHKSIDMEVLKITVTMSNELNLENTSIRALWLKRDFLTDYCPSFLSPHQMEYQHLTEAVEKELKLKNFMLEYHLEKMRKNREEYEAKVERMRLIEEEAAKTSSKKSKKEAAKKKPKKLKKMKILIEPPIVDDSTYINVTEEYEDYEMAKAEDDSYRLSPQHLNLNEHEVNMREYQITGGILKLECFERPKQTQQIDEKMFLRLNENLNVLKYQNFHHIYQDPLKLLKGRQSLSGDKLIEARFKAFKALTKIEMKLSNEIMWFESPVVCRWEAWDESDEFLQLDSNLQDYNLNYEKIIERERSKLFNAPDVNAYKKKIHLNDFQLTPYQNELKLSDLIKFYILPMMPDEYLHYHEKLEMFEKKQKLWRLNKEQEALKSSGYETYEEMKSASIEAVMSLDEFLRFFELKHAKPRNLFPESYCKRIVILENDDLMREVEAARNDLQTIAKRELELDFDEDIPLRNQPMLLSELIMEIENIQKSLIPIFKEFPNEMKSDKLEEAKKVKIKKVKKKISVKNRFQSARKSAISKRSSTRQSKITRKNSNVSEITKDEISMQTSTTQQSEQLILIPHHKGKWTTKDIYEVSFDEETKILSFYTGKYGSFGLATRKYAQLPFKNWEIYPVIQKNAEKSVILNVESQQITIDFRITCDGYRFKILNPRKAPLQEIESPIKINELKKLLTSLNINLFPENDSIWYINDVKEKHHAMEFHNYKSMAAFCLSCHFKSDKFNAISSRRNSIINIKTTDKKYFQKLLITPLHVLQINDEIEKERDDDGENECTILKCKIDPIEQEFCPDLLHFLKKEVDKSEQRVNQQSFMLIWYVQALLLNMRLLSFSE